MKSAHQQKFWFKLLLAPVTLFGPHTLSSFVFQYNNNCGIYGRVGVLGVKSNLNPTSSYF